jgi:hypothetical protein
MPKKLITTKIGDDVLKVENTWLGGLKLFLNGEIIDTHSSFFSVDKHSPVIAKRLTVDGKVRLIEVFCHAVMSVNIKIVVDGEFLSGDQF